MKRRAFLSGALSAATDANALTATQTFSNLTTSTTITGVAGLNVIDINGNINLNNMNLTLNGPAGAQFVMDVVGNAPTLRFDRAFPFNPVYPPLQFAFDKIPRKACHTAQGRQRCQRLEPCRLPKIRRNGDR